MNEENNSAITAEDNWDDIDFSDVVDEGEKDEEFLETPAQEESEESDAAAETESKADQQSGGSEGPDGGEAETESKGETDQFTLKHLDETRTVNRDEVVALAQKGMDYDRIRAKLDEKESKEASAYAFLDELAKEQNLSVEAFIDNTRASILAKKDGIDFNAALQRIQFNREKAEFEAEKKKSAESAEKAAAESKENDRMLNDISEFRKLYPDVDGKKIPQSVWDDVSHGMSLVNAYAKYDNAQKLAALQSAKKESENKAKSAGSVKTSGKSISDADFDAMWNDGT